MEIKNNPETCKIVARELMIKYKKQFITSPRDIKYIISTYDQYIDKYAREIVFLLNQYSTHDYKKSIYIRNILRIFIKSIVDTFDEKTQRRIFNSTKALLNNI